MLETRTIHTGLYSNRADELIREIVADLQDHYIGAKKTKKMASLLNSEVQRGTDNEILITSAVESRYHYSRNRRLWNGMTDKNVLCYITWLYKLLLIKHAGKDSWKRSCDAVIPMSDNNFKINEVYFIYDMFHQRKNFKRNFPQNYSDNLIGIPLDPVTVEIKNAQAAEIKKIEDELQTKLNTLASQKYNERDAAYKAIEAKYKNLETEAKAEATAKMQKIKDEMASIASLNLLANVG